MRSVRPLKQDRLKLSYYLKCDHMDLLFNGSAVSSSGTIPAFNDLTVATPIHLCKPCSRSDVYLPISYTLVSINVLLTQVESYDVAIKCHGAKESLSEFYDPFQHKSRD